jgi:hypothetical protein
MKILNTTTGLIESLSIIDPKTGLDWTQDFLGNNEAKMNYNDDTEMYEMDGDDMEWWKNVIEKYQANDNRIAEIESGLEWDDLEAFRNGLYDASSGNNDLEIHVDAVKEYLDEYETE